MKFNVDLSSEDNPDLVGELLRAKFFDQSEGLGCYESFDWNIDVVPLEDFEEKDEYGDITRWSKARWNSVICMYYWDGDGTLEFHFADGSCLFNNDCKKIYRWEYHGGKDKGE